MCARILYIWWCVNPKSLGDHSDRILIIVVQYIRRAFGRTAIQSGLSRFLTIQENLFSDLLDRTDIPLSCWFHRRIIHWLNVSRLFVYTVVSTYIPPGYKPTSALVPLKEFPYCFCYPLHSKVSFFSPTGYKHKPASVPRNCPPKHTKYPFVSRLLKIIC